MLENFFKKAKTINTAENQMGKTFFGTEKNIIKSVIHTFSYKLLCQDGCSY